MLGPRPHAWKALPAARARWGTRASGGHFTGSRRGLGSAAGGAEGVRAGTELRPGRALGPSASPRNERRPPPSRLERQECEGSAFSRAAAAAPGSSRCRPSPAAELTGSVCPTGRAALAKNSALPSASCARLELGQRFWESEPLPVHGARGAPQAPTQGLAPVPPPRPSPRAQRRSPQVPGRVEGPRAEALPRPPGMGAGGTASRALAWASLPLLGPPAGALCGDSLGCRGKAGPAARLSLFPGACRGLLLPPHPRSAGGRGQGQGVGAGPRRQPHRAVEKSLAFSVNSPLV